MHRTIETRSPRFRKKYCLTNRSRCDVLIKRMSSRAPARDHKQRRATMRGPSLAQDDHVVRPRSDVISRQPDRTENPLKIVVAVIFDLNPAAFLVVMQNDVRAEILLKPVLQIDHGGRTLCCGRTAPATTSSHTSHLPRDQSLRRAHRCAATKHRFSNKRAALPRI